jgi:hypothetical protein
MSINKGFTARGPSFKGKKKLKPDDDDVPEEEQMFPDYGFPIVYHFINHAEFTHLSSLNDYIHVQTNACNGMSHPYGAVPGSSMSPFLSSNLELCVLFMHWDVSTHLDSLKTAHDKSSYYMALNDLRFLNKHILGHAKILHHAPYLAIYNFCKHSLTITPDAIHPRDTQFGSIGFAMFTALLTATHLMPGMVEDTLWLGIDLMNPAFSKVAKIYTVSGFSDPIITNRDVTGAPLPINILQLTRPLRAHESRHLESVNNFNKVMNLVNDWNMSVRSQYNPADWTGLSTSSVVNLAGLHARIMRYRFSFDRSCILSLRLFPYVSFDAAGGAVGVTELSAQRETSGKFVSIKSVHDPDDPENSHDVLAIETTSVSSGHALRFNVGTHDSVELEWGEATFHTHPAINYRKANTSIAPPSSEDFLAFVRTFIFFQLPDQISEHQSFKFSLVSTMEGVHIISLTPQGIVFFTNLMRRLNDTDAFADETKAITDKYEYDFAERRLIWHFRSFGELRSQDALYAPIHEYATWFETTNAANGNFFKWDFVPWDEFNTIHQIEGYYLENRINLP